MDKEFVMRAYKVMFVKEQAKGETVFNFNDKGDLFYVILRGTVEVIAPLEVELQLDEKQLMIYLWEHQENIAWKKLLKAGNIRDSIENELFKQGILHLSRAKQIKELQNRYEKFFDYFTVPSSVSSLIKDDRPGYVSVPIYQKVAELSEGKAFGEKALTHGDTRNATIRCKTNCIFSCMNAENYKNILGQAARKAEVQTHKFFTSFRILKNIGKKKLRKISQNCKELLTFKRKQVIFSEGQKVDGVYFVK